MGDSVWEHRLYPEMRRAWLMPVIRKMNTHPGVGVSAFKRIKQPEARRLRVQPARIIQRGRKGYLPIPSFAVRRRIGRAGAVMVMMLRPVNGVEGSLTRKRYIDRPCKCQNT
jgi:hypothetical protein